jgi:hypothetical protein
VQEPVATLEDLEQEIYENTRQFVSRDVMEWMLKRYYTTSPAQPEPVQEPDAVVTGYYGGNCVVTPTDPARVFNTGTVFYTQPTDNSEQHLDMVNHGDELTIAYLDGVHTGKKMAKREWVGLTDEEISEIEDEYIVDYRIPSGCSWNFAKHIETELRKKNGGEA